MKDAKPVKDPLRQCNDCGAHVVKLSRHMKKHCPARQAQGSSKSGKSKSLLSKVFKRKDIERSPPPPARRSHRQKEQSVSPPQQQQRAQKAPMGRSHLEDTINPVGETRFWEVNGQICTF